jgi:hypothetical protein
MKKSLVVLVPICRLRLLSACGSGVSGATSGAKVQPLTITSAVPPPGGVQTAYGAGGRGLSLAAGGLPAASCTLQPFVSDSDLKEPS